MNEIMEKEMINIDDMIYEVCVNGTKTINQAVSRHLDRFPSDFYFQLTDSEYKKLQSQVGTANMSNMSRTLPYVFTEQGVAINEF